MNFIFTKIKFFVLVILLLITQVAFTQELDIHWAKSVYSHPVGGFSIVNHTVTDASGNLYVIGHFQGNADFHGSRNGTANLTSKGSWDVFLAKYDVSGNYIWAKAIGGTGNDRGLSVAVSGNEVYVAGYFTNTVAFDASVAVPTTLTSNGNEDLFFAKYDANGNYMWAKALGSTGQEDAISLTASASGAYLTGYFVNTIDFDPGVGTASLTSKGGGDIFLAKYDAFGNYVWAKSIGGSSYDIGYSVTLSGEDIYVTGIAVGTVDFDPGAGTANLISNGGTSIFLAKFDLTGNYVWAKGMGGNAYNVGMSVAVSGNEVYVTGYFGGTADFNPGAGTDNLISKGGEDIFLAKYDAFGNYVWAKAIGGTGNERSLSVAVSGNEVYIAGYFTNTVDFDASITGLANSASKGGEDIFFAKYDANGNYVWAKTFGSTEVDRANALTVFRSEIYVVGYFNFTVDFDPGVGIAELSTPTLEPKPLWNGFWASYQSSGNFLTAKELGGYGTDVSPDGATAIARDALGNVYVTGFFVGTADFDPGAGIANLTSKGGWDIFLAKYDAAGNYIWAKSMGGTGEDEQAWALVVTGTDVYIAGKFAGVADFDPGAGTANLRYSAYEDVFIAKYDSEGNYIWAKSISGINGDAATSLTVMGSALYVTGYFGDLADFDPRRGGQTILRGKGNPNFFLAKFDTAGNYIWARTLDGAYGAAVAVTNSGVYVTGHFYQNNDFDPGPGTAILNRKDGWDLFLAKYDENGNYMWAKAIVGDQDQKAQALVVSGSDIYITGVFRSIVDFDPGAGTAELKNNGLEDIFLAKYDTDGNYVWAKALAGALYQNVFALALSGSDIYITGYFEGTVDFDPGTSSSPLTSSIENSIYSKDIFIAKYDVLGNYQWAKALGHSAGPEVGYSLTVWGNEVYLAGSFSKTVDFDPSSTGTTNLTSVNSQDSFFGKYNSNSITGPNAPTVTGASKCGPGAVTLTASGAADGNYRWYTTATGGNAVVNAVNTSFTTPPLTATTVYYVSVVNATGVESARVAVTATINQVPEAPSATSQITYCQGATATALSATGTNLNWYTSATGGTASTTAPVPSTSAVGTTDYYVSQSVNGCESPRAKITVVITALPVVSFSPFIDPVCSSVTNLNLTGALPAGGTYSGPGVSNGVFDASIAGEGSHTITYTITTNECNISATQNITVSTCTGIKESELATSFSLYPNPAQGKVRMILPVQKRTSLALNLINAEGQVVMQKNYGRVQGEFVQELDVKDLAKGLYLLQLIAEDGIIMKRLVLQ